MAKLVVKTELDTTGLEKGLEDIKKEYSDEEIIMNTEETSKGMNAISKITEKIARSFGGITASSAKFLGNIVGTLTKLGLIGGILGVVALVVLGIANSFKNAVKENEELQAKLIYLRLLIQSAMNAFASAGEFLVKIFSWVIDRVFDVMVILGSIIKLITGINIFASKISNNFEDANSNVSQMKKTLAGFDEMNVISGGSGGVGLLGDIASDFSNLRNLQEEVNKTTIKIKEWFTKSLPTREELEANADTYKNSWIKVGEFLGLGTLFNDFKARLNELKEQLKPIWQPMIDSFNLAIDHIKNTLKPFTDYINNHFVNPIKDTFTSWKDGFLSRYAKFINKLIYGANLFLQYFGIQLDYIDEESALTGKDIEKNFNTAFENTQKRLDEKLVKPFDKFKNTLKDLTSKTWNIVTNFTVTGKDKLNQQLDPLRQSLAKIGINLPRLAKGGIINMPGRGVPIGGAIGGEQRPEGVIPLTDSQQMALLGEAIGKFVNINATVPVYVGNRLVLRELKRIEAEDNFAYNR